MMFYVTLMPHRRFCQTNNCIHAIHSLQILKNQLNHPPKRIYIFKLKHCLYWIISVKQYNSMFRINCTSTCFYVINTIVCCLNDIGWNNWFDSCIHCDAPFCFWRIFLGVRLHPGDLYTEPPPRAITDYRTYVFIRKTNVWHIHTILYLVFYIQLIQHIDLQRI